MEFLCDVKEFRGLSPEKLGKRPFFKIYVTFFTIHVCNI